MYVLDSNVFIEAKNRYYAADIAPGFWTWLGLVHQQSIACSIEAVRSELLVGDDELAEWADTHASFFKPIDIQTTSYFRELSTWAQSQNYKPVAINQFTNNHADYLLIAYAMAHGHTVATMEKSQPGARRRILIPDVCKAMKVNTVDTFGMLRKTGARLILGL